MYREEKERGKKEEEGDSCELARPGAEYYKALLLLLFLRSWCKSLLAAVMEAVAAAAAHATVGPFSFVCALSLLLYTVVVGLFFIMSRQNGPAQT